MQEDALLKTGPLAHPKKNYQKKKHDQFSQESYQSVPKVSRSRQKKKKQPNASELLSFKFETKEQMPPKMLVRRAPQGISDITLSPYFRFAVEAGDYSLYQNDPNMVIPWDSVRKITILADSEVKCPICLESELLSGRANKCGHYYCWPCIIRYLWTVNGPKRCPVCSDSLRPVDLRPVSFELYKTISERDTAKFVLIKRPKGMITLFKNDQPADNTFMGVLRSDSYHANINKISIYTQAIQDLQNDKASLQSALSLSDDFEKTSIENALNLLEKYPPNTTVPLEFNMKTSPYGFYYFYQLFDSQPYFLHPLNISMLKKELGEYENFPGTITGKILEIERVHIGDYEQKRYG